MSSEEVFEKVKAIIIEQLQSAEASVTMEASFIDDLGADSLDLVELIMALEEEFDIEIPDAEMREALFMRETAPKQITAEVLKKTLKHNTLKESEEIIKNYSSPYTSSSSGCMFVLPILIGLLDLLVS